MQTYSTGKPTLVFCMSRKSTEMTASHLANNLSFHKVLPAAVSATINKISEQKLKKLVLRGVGYHHAGVSYGDRQCVEQIFISGFLPVLCKDKAMRELLNMTLFRFNKHSRGWC